jgi:hypothetical protein
MIIIDDFVQDKRLLTKIALDNRFLTEGYHWWGGWWNEPISSIRHELITYIWRDNCPLNEGFEIQGFEHWTGVYQPGDEKVTKNFGFRHHLKHHFDKDEKVWNETGEVIRPKIGTVFYFNPEVDNSEGGYLQLWDTYNSDATNLPYELIRPKFNRLVIFDAGKLHAVQEVTKGIRHAVAINLWSQAPADVANMLK